MMQRCERKYIDLWVSKNGPDGILELARKSGVSASTITQARLGRPPKKQFMRDRICEAIGVAEQKLFPAEKS